MTKEQIGEEIKKLLNDDERKDDIITALRSDNFAELVDILSSYEMRIIFASLIQDEESMKYVNGIFHQLTYFKFDWLREVTDPKFITSLYIPENTTPSDINLLTGGTYLNEYIKEIKLFVKELPEDSLHNLVSLQTLYLENCKEIPAGFAANNPELTDVYIPEYVTHIHYKAFSSCPKLKLHIKKNQHIQVTTADKDYLKNHIVWEE